MSMSTRQTELLQKRPTDVFYLYRPMSLKPHVFHNPALFPRAEFLALMQRKQSTFCQPNCLRFLRFLPRSAVWTPPGPVLFPRTWHWSPTMRSNLPRQVLDCCFLCLLRSAVWSPLGPALSPRALPGGVRRPSTRKAFSAPFPRSSAASLGSTLVTCWCTTRYAREQVSTFLVHLFSSVSEYCLRWSS